MLRWRGGSTRLRDKDRQRLKPRKFAEADLATPLEVSIRQHTSAYASIRQHTSAYVSIRQHTSAYVSIRQHAWRRRWRQTSERNSDCSCTNVLLSPALCLA
jgi:hypothetical protein